jgi:hypothetical protein
MSFDQWNNQADTVNLSQWLANQQGPKQAGNTKKKGRGGTLTSLISEVGGTGGAVGGAAAGAALGSVVPILGTAVGGLIGAGLGGFLGGTGGRAIENKVRDDQNFLGAGGSARDALTEGVISGISGAGPIRSGKALIGGAKALKGASKLAPGVATTLEDAVAEQAGKVPLKTSVQGKLASTGTDLLTSQYPTLTAPMARATNLKKTVGALSDMGIVKPQDSERIAHAVTGADGIINKAVLTATGGAGKVPIHNIQTVAQQAIGDLGLVDSDAKSVMAIVNAQSGRLGDGTHAEPAKVLKVMKALEARVADLKGKGGNAKLTDPVREDKAQALLAVRNELQDQLYNTAGANKNLGSVLTPELRDKLVTLHPNNPQWQSHVDNIIMKSKDIGSLRHSMEPFVNISKAIEAGDINSVTAGGRFGNAIKNGAGIGNIVASGAMDVAADPLARITGQALRKAGGALPEAATAGAIKGTAAGTPGIIGRELTGNAIGTGLGVKGGQTANAQSLEEALMQQNGSQDPSMQQGGLDPSMQEPQSQMPYSKENLLGDIQRDPKNAAKYIDYYNQLDTIFNPPVKDAGPGYTKPTSQQYAQGVTGSNSIDQIQQMVSQDPGIVNRAATPGQGIPIVGSLISRGTNTTAYRGAGQNILNSIARINTGANMPESERKFYEQTYLPQPGDPPAAIQQKLATLRQFFAPITNYQGGSSSNQLSDAIQQAQQQGAY